LLKTFHLEYSKSLEFLQSKLIPRKFPLQCREIDRFSPLFLHTITKLLDEWGGKWFTDLVI